MVNNKSLLKISNFHGEIITSQIFKKLIYIILVHSRILFPRNNLIEFQLQKAQTCSLQKNQRSNIVRCCKMHHSNLVRCCKMQMLPKVSWAARARPVTRNAMDSIPVLIISIYYTDVGSLKVGTQTSSSRLLLHSTQRRRIRYSPFKLRCVNRCSRVGKLALLFENE